MPKKTKAKDEPVVEAPLKPEEKHVLLRYKAGGSDKDYQVHLVPQAGGWVVNFEYGRHGQSMTAGTKTESPLDFEAAAKVYDQSIKKQMTKGYTTSGTGVLYAGTDKADRVSGVLPQLLNFIEEEELGKYFRDDKYIMQEKKDGRRVIVRKRGDEVQGINRKGLTVPIHEDVHAAASIWLDYSVTLDGEMIGNTYYIFDVLEVNGQDLHGESYAQRYVRLIPLGREASPHLVVLPCYTGEAEKRRKFAEIEAENGEGVVFKDKDAIYTAGRPNSYGPQTKYKFYATVVGTGGETPHPTDGVWKCSSRAIPRPPTSGRLPSHPTTTSPRRASSPRLGIYMPIPTADACTSLYTTG